MTNARTFPALTAAFSDFDVASLPAIPADWTEASWRNDACPSFFAHNHEGDDFWSLQVFVDYADEDQRDSGAEERFTVMFSHHKIDGTGVDLLHTSDWDAVLALTNGFDPKAAISLPDGILAEVTDRDSAEAWIKALVAADLMFHFEDDPETIVNIKTDEPIFTKAGAVIIIARVASLYEQQWGDLECPIGFALTLPGVAA